MKLFYLPRLLPVTLLALFLPLAAGAEDAVVKKADGILVSSAGMTLYTFDKDTPGSGKSACTGGCASLWPPLTVTSAPSDKSFSTVKRDDGSMQLAYEGKPLYRYSADKKAGDRNGDNFKDIWHVAKSR